MEFMKNLSVYEKNRLAQYHYRRSKNFENTLLRYYEGQRKETQEKYDKIYKPEMTDYGHCLVDHGGCGRINGRVKYVSYCGGNGYEYIEENKPVPPFHVECHAIGI